MILEARNAYRRVDNDSLKLSACKAEITGNGNKKTWANLMKTHSPFDSPRPNPATNTNIRTRAHTHTHKPPCKSPCNPSAYGRRDGGDHDGLRVAAKALLQNTGQLRVAVGHQLLPLLLCRRVVCQRLDDVTQRRQRLKNEGGKRGGGIRDSAHMHVWVGVNRQQRSSPKGKKGQRGDNGIGPQRPSATIVSRKGRRVGDWRTWLMAEPS